MEGKNVNYFFFRNLNYMEIDISFLIVKYNAIQYFICYTN